MLSPANAPSAPATITQPSDSSPTTESSPAMISAASLGNAGKTAVAEREREDDQVRLGRLREQVEGGVEHAAMIAAPPARRQYREARVPESDSRP